MSRTSKSPLKTAKAAYEAGQKALPRYAHKYSRRDFTCPQLFAILVLRKFFKTDYRGVGPRPDVDELRPLTESMATPAPEKGTFYFSGAGAVKVECPLFGAVKVECPERH